MVCPLILVIPPLDLPSAFQLSAILRRLLVSGRTLIWVTHHPGEIPPEIQRVILLKDGMLFADGPRQKVLNARTLGELYETNIRVRHTHGWCDVRPL